MGSIKLFQLAVESELNPNLGQSKYKTVALNSYFNPNLLADICFLKVLKNFAIKR